MSRFHCIVGLLMVSALLVGCFQSTTFEGECRRNSDCAPFERCDTLEFRCVCTDNQACALGEECNQSGSCQMVAGCFSNQDCLGSEQKCDYLSGACVAMENCASDFQCPLGTLCLENGCQATCERDDDCEVYERQACIEGTCKFKGCVVHSHCDFGEFCDPIDKECVSSTEPHCQPGCDPLCLECKDPNLGPCGRPDNFCLGTTTENSYCLVACQDNSACPSGYDCVPTSVGWIASCKTVADCTTNQHFNDRVINVCEAYEPRRCRITRQPCGSDNDCWPIEVACLAGKCVFGHHCLPTNLCLGS